MPKKSEAVKPRSFDLSSIPNLSNEAREALNEALEAMSNWRSEIANDNERNSRRVIEKMAEAATAMGWPEQVVDVARIQLQSITEMQIKTMDHMMDAWEEQLQLPDAANASPSAMLSRLQSFQTATRPGE